MSITRFRPEIWSANLLVALRKALVYAGPGMVNRDYEGDIQQAGDTVRITSISDPTIGTYSANSTVISPEELTAFVTRTLRDRKATDEPTLPEPLEAHDDWEETDHSTWDWDDHRVG